MFSPHTWIYTDSHLISESKDFLIYNGETFAENELAHDALLQKRSCSCTKDFHVAPYFQYDQVKMFKPRVVSIEDIMIIAEGICILTQRIGWF